jgi:hypothetical protein
MITTLASSKHVNGLPIVRTDSTVVKYYRYAKSDSSRKVQVQKKHQKNRYMIKIIQILLTKVGDLAKPSGHF